MILRVALAQISTRIGDLEGNKEKHLSYIRLAKREGADLVVFPELSLTGYLLKDLAYEVPKHCAAAIQELASECIDIHAVVGFVHEVRPGIVCNAAAVLGQGKVRCIIPKFYLPTYGLFEEGRYFKPGDPLRDLKVVDAGFGTFGVLICEDLWHPEPAEALALMGAEVIICIASSPLRGLNRPIGGRPWIDHAWSALTTSAALMYGVHVVFVNRAGHEDEEFFWGGSRIVAPDGVERCSCSIMDEDFKICEIDLSENTRARRFSSFRIHLRDFHRALARL